MKRQQTSSTLVYKTRGGRDEWGCGMREWTGEVTRREREERSREDGGGTRGQRVEVISRLLGN